MEPTIKETAWNPEIEKQILKQWEESHIYDFKPEGDVFVIDTPPPTHQADHGTLVQHHIMPR
jgi:Valyl-tRNA synthetase